MSNRASYNSYILINHNRLKEALSELADFVCKNALQINLYRLPNLPLGAEDTLPSSIEISRSYTHVDDQSKLFLRKAITQIEVDAFSENTYLAKRYPGIVVLPSELEATFNNLNDVANSLRDEFYYSIKRGFDNRQSIHDNLHKLIPNLVMLSAVRKLRALSTEANEIASANFYWLSKKMVKHVKHDLAEKIINEGLHNIRNSDCFGLTRQEILDRHKKELDLISRVPKSFKIVEVRYARVQPFVDIWVRDSGDSSNHRALSVNATLPVVLFKSPNQINPLKNYISKPNKAITLPALILRKHWYVK